MGHIGTVWLVYIVRVWLCSFILWLFDIVRVYSIFQAEFFGDIFVFLLQILAEFLLHAHIWACNFHIQ
jgi:hypothetical protein